MGVPLGIKLLDDQQQSFGAIYNAQVAELQTVFEQSLTWLREHYEGVFQTTNLYPFI